MVAKRDTRQRIADEFVTRVRETSLSQVRIADLISSLGINRNTFYYHFASKYDVAMWVLRTRLASELRDALPASKLVSAPFKEGDRESLPYYVHIEIGARMLDSEPFFRAMGRCVLSDTAFYRKLFNAHEVEFLTQVKHLWTPAFYDDIGFILDRRHMPDATRRMLGTLSAHIMLAYVMHLLENANEGDILLDREANPFGNILQESLHSAIQRHPINRRTSLRGSLDASNR